MNKDTKTGLLALKQTRFIDRIIEAMGLDVGTVNGKSKLDPNAPLVKNIEGLNVKGDFSYRSVAGMLFICLGTHTLI